jgi:hypothetical protein
MSDYTKLIELGLALFLIVVVSVPAAKVLFAWLMKRDDKALEQSIQREKDLGDRLREVEDSRIQDLKEVHEKTVQTVHANTMAVQQLGVALTQLSATLSQRPCILERGQEKQP